jgi:hypothetical protein
MADYVLPSVVEKRVRYFDGQFLQDQDFIDEQNYQLDHEHRHNRLLHGPGIADGLTVTSTTPNQVTVAPGTAIDSDGRQLALAEATTVDLPAADFNDKQGIQLYISYLESAEDPQAVGGSQDFTRWLERPQLTVVAPDKEYSGSAPPVLLASVALDNAGRVAVDNTVRSYAGLRLPGAAADAVTLRATSGGPVDLAGSLTVDDSVGIGNPNPAFPLHLAVGKALRIEAGSSSSDSAAYFSFGGNGDFGIDAPGVPSGRFVVQNSGHVGIGATAPGNDLEVGAFQGQDRFLAFKVAGGNAYRSGLKLWAWKDNNGFSIQYDERNQTGNGLHIKTHNANADGTTQLFVGWSGNIGIGTTNPGNLKLNVVGSTLLQGDLFVGGRLIYSNGPNSWWQIYPRQSGLDPALWAGSNGVGGPSDIRLKTDLRPISHALDLVRKLRGVRYQWGDEGLARFTRDIEDSVLAGPDATDEQNHERQQAERRRALETLAGDRMGLVAQDVETVAPELVHEDEDGYKHIRYQHLTALLAEAIKEQDAVVQALSAEVAALQAKQ